MAARPLKIDPLSSCNDGEAKRAIINFVVRTSTVGGPDFVPRARRIAVFDNDGTLWSEQPMYVQLAFALDRVRALAPKHPDWQTKHPFKAALEGDMKTLAELGARAIAELVMATHAGMTTDEFREIARDWLVTTSPGGVRPGSGAGANAATAGASAPSRSQSASGSSHNSPRRQLMERFSFACESSCPPASRSHRLPAATRGAFDGEPSTEPRA